jgi:hypothetical protein
MTSKNRTLETMLGVHLDGMVASVGYSTLWARQPTCWCVSATMEGLAAWFKSEHQSRF